MSKSATQPLGQSNDPLRRFMPVYACVTIVCSVLALGLQAVGRFSGAIGTALVLVAVPAIVSVIALGWSSAFALAGIVQQRFFSHRVCLKPAQRGMAGAK